MSENYLKISMMDNTFKPFIKSRKVQEYLFSKGFKWLWHGWDIYNNSEPAPYVKGLNISFISKPQIYVCISDKVISHKPLSNTTIDVTFDELKQIVEKTMDNMTYKIYLNLTSKEIELLRNSTSDLGTTDKDSVGLLLKIANGLLDSGYVKS